MKITENRKYIFPATVIPELIQNFRQLCIDFDSKSFCMAGFNPGIHDVISLYFFVPTQICHINKIDAPCVVTEQKIKFSILTSWYHQDYFNSICKSHFLHPVFSDPYLRGEMIELQCFL